MRIGLMYLGRRPVGGHTLQLAKALSKKADIFAVVSRNSDVFDQWQQSGISMLDVPTFESYAGAFISYLNRPRLRKLASDIRGFTPDVLVTYMVHPWTPSIQQYLRDIPHVITVHDPMPHPGIIHSMSSSWEAVSARRATRAVVMSNALVSDLERRGVLKEQIDVIPHGILSFYDSGVRSQTERRDPNLFLFFGRITAYKGLDVLLRAFLDVNSRFPDTALEIVG